MLGGAPGGIASETAEGKVVHTLGKQTNKFTFVLVAKTMLERIRFCMDKYLIEAVLSLENSRPPRP
jgi:hypothetical protein